jgi:hypothetical protein
MIFLPSARRISSIILIFSGILAYNIIYNIDAIAGIGIYNGLFNININITSKHHILILEIFLLILVVLIFLIIIVVKLILFLKIVIIDFLILQMLLIILQHPLLH